MGKHKNWVLSDGFYPSGEGGNKDWWILEEQNVYLQDSGVTTETAEFAMLNCSRALAEKIHRLLQESAALESQEPKYLDFWKAFREDEQPKE